MASDIIVQNLKTLRRGQTKGLEEEVVFLHKLLNYHLEPPDDQLPVQGPDAAEFGPRTEAKVKKFQQVNRLFVDGVVGGNTWAALSEPLMVKAFVIPALKLTLPPLVFPPTPPTPPIVPKLTPPVVPGLTPPVVRGLKHPISVQSGAQFTLDRSGASVAESLQVSAILIKKKDGKFRPEFQFGGTTALNATIRGTPSTDLADVGLVAVVSTGDLPGSKGIFAWSAQAQAALSKSLTDRAGSGQLTHVLEVDVTVYKRDNVDSIKITAAGGPVLTLGVDNNGNWQGKVGHVVFFGLTFTFGERADPNK
jgi:Putative peptidoglycan binding domain